MKTAFLIKNSWVGIFDRLSDKQAGMLIKMLGHYNVEGGVPEGMNDEVVNAYFNLVSLDCDELKLEIDAQEYEPENEEKKRGAPKGSRNNPNGRKGGNKTNSELNKTNSELVNFENAPHVINITAPDI